MIHRIFNDPLQLYNDTTTIHTDMFDVISDVNNVPFDLRLETNYGPEEHYNIPARVSLHKKLNANTINFTQASDFSGSFNDPNVYVIVLSDNDLFSIVEYTVDTDGISLITPNLIKNNPISSLPITSQQEVTTKDQIKFYNFGYNNNRFNFTQVLLASRLVSIDGLYTRSNIDSIISPNEPLINYDNSGYKIGSSYTIYPYGMYADEVPNFVKPGISLKLNLSTQTVSITGGSGYVLGDVFSIVGGDTNGSIEVSSVSESGAILSTNISNYGSNFSSLPTVSYDGSTGANADIVVNNDFSIEDITLTSYGFPFTNGHPGIIKEDLPTEPASNSQQARVLYSTDDPGYYVSLDRNAFTIDSVTVDTYGTGYSSFAKLEFYTNGVKVPNKFLSYKPGASLLNIVRQPTRRNDTYFTGQTTIDRIYNNLVNTIN